MNKNDQKSLHKKSAMQRHPSHWQSLQQSNLPRASFQELLAILAYSSTPLAVYTEVGQRPLRVNVHLAFPSLYPPATTMLIQFESSTVCAEILRVVLKRCFTASFFSSLGCPRLQLFFRSRSFDNSNANGFSSRRPRQQPPTARKLSRSAAFRPRAESPS